MLYWTLINLGWALEVTSRPQNIVSKESKETMGKYCLISLKLVLKAIHFLVKLYLGKYFINFDFFP